MYVPLAANTSTTVEGPVGTSIPVSVLNTTAVIGEYADYANFSSLSLATAIDNTVENVAREMSYRLGESLSSLVRLTADGASAVDASVCIIGLVVSTPARRRSAATDTTSGRSVTLQITTTGAVRLPGSCDLRTHATTSGLVSAMRSVAPTRRAEFS